MVSELGAHSSYDIAYIHQHKNYNTFETVMTLNDNI